MIDLVLEGHAPPSAEHVIERAGVSQASLFRYFATLDELRQEAIGRYFERFDGLIAIPQPAGMGSLNLQVPVIPGLIGTPIYAQSLLVSNALPPRLSNVVPDQYTPLPAPTISSIQPVVAGPGTPVTITGTNFLQGIVLTVGGNPTPITTQTPTTIDFTMPLGSGCDAMITGEATFHVCLEAESRGIGLGLLGHYFSERFAMERLAESLGQELPDLAIWPSNNEHDPLSAVRRPA